MRTHIFAFACFCSIAVIINAVPLPAGNEELDLLQIPLDNGKELDVLTVGAKDQEAMIAERNKRTIGLLRELFPDITKQIDGIVNRIIAQVIRVAGPSVFTSLLGNRPTTSRPDFSSGFDEDDDSEDDNSFDDLDDDKDTNSDENDINTRSSSKDVARVRINLPTFAPESTSNGNDIPSTTVATTN